MCLLWFRALLVSMVDGHLFEKISAIAARLRKKTDRPFGGIQVGPVFCNYLSVMMTFVQLVITGDFFQLPPVTKGGAQPFFAFECDAWKACIRHIVTLTQVFRQKDDSACFCPSKLVQWGRLSESRVRSTAKRAPSRLHHNRRDRVLSRALPSYCIQ